MKRNTGAEVRRSLLLSFVVLILIGAIIWLPSQFRSAAINQTTVGHQETEEHSRGLEDYDFRHQKTSTVFELLMDFRQASNVDAAMIADVRDRFVRGENALKQTVPTLKIEYNKELENPEVIAPDVLQGRAFLTAPSNAKRAEILRSFSKTNKDLLALTDEQISRLKITADYANPNGELSFARMEQFVGGIPVFRAEIRAGFNKEGAMFRAVNNLAPALEYERLSKNFGDPAEAVRRAAAFINYELKPSDTALNETTSTDLKAVFGNGDWATTAEKMYFPVEAGVARAAWRVLIWQPVDVYYVIVDAETGTMLYRENITKDQTQAATYNVYANTTSLMKTMANPAPLPGPGLLDPELRTQGVLQPRSNMTLIGNEAPYTFNNNGWITDNTNGTNGHTDGNNVEAGLDRVAPNGVDAPVQGTNRVFNFNYTPGAGLGTEGESPLLPDFQKGAVTHLFYASNRFHDETYLLGFTEQARNFQQDNFGRGGLGNDRVSAEAQDSSGTNNANFATPADGGRGRMQMYIWTPPNPDRDGDLDTEIVVHELTHGLFARLHNGIGGTQAGQMNEGNSDFFAHVLLSETTDPINGVYVTGGYSTLNLRTTVFGGQANYYYGIRRFPKAVISFTGGTMNRPHNPLTYADIDPAQINLTNGAFAPAFNGSATAVHDGGEIWSSMLWEVRARLVQRLGAVAGNKKVLQLVMDGMKVSPSNPTMLAERNAILSAALANGNGGDVGDVWAGFAARGLGFSATNPSANTVTEGFDLPNLVQTPTFTFSDAGGNNNGFADPGETLQLSIPLTNNTGNTATGTTLQVVGGSTADYGTIANGQTVTRTVSYTVPAAAECGSLLTITLNINSSLGAKTETRTLVVGEPIITYSENFDGVTAPALPTGWTSTVIAAGLGFNTVTTTPDSAPNSAFAAGAETAGGSDLTSPEIPITTSSAVLTFRHRYDLQTTFDGATLEIKIGGGAFQNIETAGGVFTQGGFQITLGGTSNPINGQRGWNGNSNGYITSSVRLPAAANNQNVQLRFRIGHNINTVSAGWNVDNIQIRGGYTCDVVSSTKVRADFDGDGKTDFSVFRPSEGNWYLNRSTAGFTGIGWGANGDKLAPGDFDGDGKTDVAVARSNGGALTFYVLNSGNATQTTLQWGVATDIPVVGDYDGDGKTDIAVFRPSNGGWYIRNSNGGTTTSLAFGQAGDLPVANDFDGDGKTDVAVFRAGTWYIQRSQLGFTGVAFGLGTDKPVPADYDGDGKCDIAVYRDGVWYLQRSNLGFTGIAFGIATDVPVPGDYDGDGKYDVAVFRGGTWYAIRSTAGLMTANFGVTSDLPIPKQYIP